MRNKTTKALIVMLALAWGIAPVSAQHFKQIPGSLTQVAAGRNEVFGVNASNQVFRFNAETNAFVQIPGSLAQVAVGGGTLIQKDQVWGVGTAGQIYHFNYTTNTLAKVAGNLAQIVVGEGYQDKCHPYEVWGLDSAQSIFRYNSCTKAFDSIPGSLTQIATGGGSTWGLNSSAQIFFFEIDSKNDPGRFTQSPGSLQQITVGMDHVLGLDGNGLLYQVDDADALWSRNAFGGAYAQVAAGGDGVWLINARGFPEQIKDPHFINTYTTSLAKIVVGSGAGVWGIDSSNRVYVFVRP